MEGPRVLLGIVHRLRDDVIAHLRRRRSQHLGRLLYCRGLSAIDTSNTSPGWVGHRTTGAESAVAEYILQRGLAGGANVLHVGVGNGDFGNRLRSAGAVLQGVSISGGEISNARGHYTTVHLVNKYDADALASRLDGSRFDWIVDVNLFSYTCCWGHAIRYFWLLVSFLAENGKVISHASGSAYAPTGFCLTPSLLQQLASAAETTVVFKGNGVTLIEAKGKGRQCRPDGA